MGEEYRADPYLRAAIALQRLGEEKAGQVLLQLAAKDPWPYTRVLVLCRMLFEPGWYGQFRRARIGGVACIATPRGGSWPREPIDIEQGIPFFVATFYILGGSPEDPADYVKYCREKCAWSHVRYELKTADQKQRALDKLMEKVEEPKGFREYFEAQLR
jgi:hypothetical protein